MDKGFWRQIQDALFPRTCLLCRGRLDGDEMVSRLLCNDCLGDFECNPKACHRCAEPMTQTEPVSGTLLCGRCQKKPPAFHQILAPYLYCYPVSELIQRFKSQDHMLLNRLLSDLLSDYLMGQLDAEMIKRPDILLPVPTHWRTRLQRGFNPAACLADAVGRQLAIPVNMSVLRKPVMTHSQHDLNRAQRLKNLDQSFALRDGTEVQGREIAVVDDVVTTGSTADVIASLLRDNGAASVQVWAIARTPNQRR
ncbi:ComF family protein [Oceanospirillum linum]|uniref:Double zinc ribbon domain-containing protein n=1 Tax=Oceanospirillum linum TaxID=966 RepID=A0A1T1HF58_OCELI|nr:ComF family protein [Oceanospirillum linum]OOV88456.1 hypothetical protein BTA35_0202805 [Oceanospirillum linum]SEF56946.1 comF family protein [Oleiphilus messinensis]SMP05701.1 comF family protein [Oceanospirillum linum]